MRALHLFCSGTIGGIEVLIREYAARASIDSSYLMLWKPGPISEEMQRAGYDAQVYDTCPRRYLSDFFRFLRLYRKGRYDVVVCHQSSPLIGLYLLGLQLFCRDVKIIAYAHSNPREWPRKLRWSAGTIYARAKKVVCISDSVQRAVRQVFHLEEKAIRIYNGVCLETFSSGPCKTASPVLRLLYVGRLIPEKGVDNILRSLAVLPGEIPWQLEIAGDGPHRPELEQLCRALHLENQVAFLGSRQDIPRLCSNADVFVHLPNCEEGFGITITEAMAAGLICIGNQRGALPEIIRDGTNGFLISENPGQVFSDVIALIYDHQKKGDPCGFLQQLRDQAQKRAADFSIEAYVDNLEDLIRTVCAH